MSEPLVSTSPHDGLWEWLCVHCNGTGLVSADSQDVAHTRAKRDHDAARTCRESPIASRYETTWDRVKRERGVRA